METCIISFSIQWYRNICKTFKKTWNIKILFSHRIRRVSLYTTWILSSIYFRKFNRTQYTLYNFKAYDFSIFYMIPSRAILILGPQNFRWTMINLNSIYSNTNYRWGNTKRQIKQYNNEKVVIRSAKKLNYNFKEPYLFLTFTIVIWSHGHNSRNTIRKIITGSASESAVYNLYDNLTLISTLECFLAIWSRKGDPQFYRPKNRKCLNMLNHELSAY